MFILVGLSAIGWANSAFANEDELRLAMGLRERRLFEQAEFVCRRAFDELADSTKESPIQAAWVVELIRNHSDQARFASLDQRSSYWQAARKEAERFLIEQPEHSRKLVVQLQAALIDLDRVELYQQEKEFGVASDLDRKQALDLNRSLRKELRLIGQQITNQLQVARNHSIASGAMTLDELSNLQRNVQFQTAQAGLQGARLYETNSEEEALNRVSALTEVLSQLISLQRLNQPGTDLWWETQLALARCCRQLSDFTKAQAMLDRAGDADLRRQRKKWHVPILAEQAELLLAGRLKTTREMELAMQLLLAIDRQPIASPRLDWLALRMVTTVDIDSMTESSRQGQLEQAERRANLIDRQHGPWWGSRAKQLVLRTFQQAGRQGDELEKQFSDLVKQAQIAMEAKQFIEASATFDQAAILAKQSGDTAAWRSCQVNASRALEQLGSHGLAAKKLLETANEQPTHSAAASIHLRGIWNLGQYLSKTDQSKDAFSKALQEHLGLWPQSKTADQVRLWFGKDRLAAKESSTAVQVLLEVSKESIYRPEAIRVAAGALETSKDAEAPSILDTLVTERPDDITLLLAQARVQTRIGLGQRPIRGDDPLTSWRDLARRLKSETDHWFEAKYNVAKILFAVGEAEQATQLLDYMSALPGGWSGSRFASQLTELQGQLQAQASGK